MATFDGSASVKICQCNENLAVVDERLLFRGAVTEEFHCTEYVHSGRHKCHYTPI